MPGEQRQHGIHRRGVGLVEQPHDDFVTALRRSELLMAMRIPALVAKASRELLIASGRVSTMPLANSGSLPRLSIPRPRKEGSVGNI